MLFQCASKLDKWVSIWLLKEVNERKKDKRRCATSYHRPAPT
jgi:hypothetical protein